MSTVDQGIWERKCLKIQIILLFITMYWIKRWEPFNDGKFNLRKHTVKSEWLYFISIFLLLN